MNWKFQPSHLFLSLFSDNISKPSTATSNLPDLSGCLRTHKCRFKLLLTRNQRLPGFVISCHFAINRSVSELLTCLLMMCILLWLVLKLWCSQTIFFSIIEFVKSILVVFSMKLIFMLIDQIACFRLRLKSFDSTCGFISSLNRFHWSVLSSSLKPCSLIVWYIRYFRPCLITDPLCDSLSREY